MLEKCKLKYLKISENEDLVYEIIDKWNVLLNKKVLLSKEEKIRELDQIKNKDFKLYQSMKEDIYAGLY